MKNVLLISVVFMLACKANTVKGQSDSIISPEKIKVIIKDWNVDSLGLLGLRYSHIEEFVVKYDFSQENRLSFVQKFGKPNFVYEGDSFTILRYNLKCMQFKTSKVSCEMGFYIQFDHRDKFDKKGTVIYD